MEILVTVLLGLGTVFLGLGCIIGIIELMHIVVATMEKKKKTGKAPEVLDAKSVLPHGKLVAVLAAVIAEDMGKDISAIRIKSIKRIK